MHIGSRALYVYKQFPTSLTSWLDARCGFSTGHTTATFHSLNYFSA